MVHRPRFGIFLLSLAFAGAMAGGRAQAGEDDSPFLSAAPSGAAAGGAGQSQAFELAGASVTSKRTDVCIYDVQAKRSHWIAVGESSNQIQVVSYDPIKDEVVIRANGTQESLTLRKPAVTIAASPGSSQAMPFPSPAPLPDSLHLAPPAVPPAKSSEMARQEREARMLVSDLLEIGIEQRKAYEAAARKAAANK
jgi:hypothetical protein